MPPPPWVPTVGFSLGHLSVNIYVIMIFFFNLPVHDMSSKFGTSEHLLFHFKFIFVIIKCIIHEFLGTFSYPDSSPSVAFGFHIQHTGN